MGWRAGGCQGGGGGAAGALVHTRFRPWSAESGDSASGLPTVASGPLRVPASLWRLAARACVLATPAARCSARRAQAAESSAAQASSSWSTAVAMGRGDAAAYGKRSAAMSSGSANAAMREYGNGGGGLTEDVEREGRVSLFEARQP